MEHTCFKIMEVKYHMVRSTQILLTRKEIWSSNGRSNTQTQLLDNLVLSKLDFLSILMKSSSLMLKLIMSHYILTTLVRTSKSTGKCMITSPPIRLSGPTLMV